MSDDQYGQLLRWFEKLSLRMEMGFQSLEERIAALQTDAHDVRELLADMRDDLRVQREAIANAARRADMLEETRS